MSWEELIFELADPQRKVVRSGHGLWPAGVLLMVCATTAWAQPTAEDGIPIRVERPLVSSFEIGAVLSVPERIRTSDRTSKVLSCKVICSHFEPRQSLAEVAWPEQPGAADLDTRRLRLDIIGSASRFADGNFGTVRIGAIPSVETRAGEGINLEAVRKHAQPVFVQRVENHRVMARSPDLPPPDELKKERLPRALPELPQAAKEVAERDLQAGGFGRMQVVAQSVEIKRSVAQRNLMLEGLQPGLSYKVRLVHEGASGTTDSVAEALCRVPVCPADFMDQR